MFKPFKSRQAAVLHHEYVPVPGFQTSTQGFYDSIETELKARQVPGLEISREDFAEGGPLSDKRTYLRLLRERLVFDICAAPFGKDFFFSLRLAEIPSKISLMQVVFVLMMLAGGFYGCVQLLDLMWGSVLLVFLMALFIWIARNSAALGLPDMDANLIRSPICGTLYEKFFRKETYYRQDTRMMYLETVREVMKLVVEEVTSARGIKLLRMQVQSPILADLYKPTTIEPKPKPKTPAPKDEEGVMVA